jgi:hypothetical protein
METKNAVVANSGMEEMEFYVLSLGIIVGI